MHCYKENILRYKILIYVHLLQGYALKDKPIYCFVDMQTLFFYVICDLTDCMPYKSFKKIFFTSASMTFGFYWRRHLEAESLLFSSASLMFELWLEKSILTLFKGQFSGTLDF